MVACAYDARTQVEDGVEVDQSRGGFRRHQAHLVEDHRHQHRSEEFEKALDPQMDDPETPVVDDREIGVGPVEHRGQIEQRDGDRSVEEQGREFPLIIGFHGRPQSAEHQEKPENEASGQEHLPETAQIQVLAALVTQPEPQGAQLSIDAEVFPEQAAEDHDGQSGQQDQYARLLALRFRAPYQGRQE